MFALRFRFLADRYHATPWGRNVNEGDVAWPPEPWRLLRALVGAYWRKGDHERWPDRALSRLIDALAETSPVYRLPEGAIHAHTRHYMPQRRGKTALIFDAFVRIPKDGMIIAAWPDVTLDGDSFALAADLATAIGYLGRAESWTECEALADWHEEPNCGPAAAGFSGDPVRVLAPLPSSAYAAQRARLIVDEEQRISAAAKKPSTPTRLESQVIKALRSKAGKNTLPERLSDAIALDTADYQERGWPRPPAAREIVYARAEQVAVGTAPRAARQRVQAASAANVPTVARYLLAGRPRPRVEDTVRIGETMRLAALAQFGGQRDRSSGRRVWLAPGSISGRGDDGEPLRDPAHRHAFWLPEDADSDGWIDHVSVFIGGGIDSEVRVKLDRITRLWLEPRHRMDDGGVSASREWRLALEGFGTPADFAGSAPIFGRSTRWRSATPFLAAGHLKTAGYAGEFRRLVHRMGIDTRFGFDAAEIDVSTLQQISVGGSTRRATHFRRFRSRGGEQQHDTMGALLEVVFPVSVTGPLAVGFGSHFGLGLFASVDEG